MTTKSNPKNTHMPCKTMPKYNIFIFLSTLYNQRQSIEYSVLPDYMDHELTNGLFVRHCINTAQIGTNIRLLLIPTTDQSIMSIQNRPGRSLIYLVNLYISVSP